MSKTKGPWFISSVEGKDHELMIGADDGSDVICDLRIDKHDDAALISSAPEMLEVLGIICDQCLDLTFDQLCLVKDVIRKANGGE